MMILFISAKTRQRFYQLLPLFVVLLAAALRFYALDNQSLWNDEGNSLRLAQRTFPDLIQTASHDIHPPGYYLALSMWRNLTGDSEFALRLLSAFAGVLTVACVFALGRSLFAWGAGLVAALLIAMNSFSVYYAQEARMYSLLALFAAASMLAFVRWLKQPTWLRAVILAVLNAAGLYTQYTYPAVMLTQGILFVVWWLPKRDLPRLGRFIALNLLTILLFVPQLGTALTQVTSWPRTGEPVDPAIAFSTVARWLVYGNTASVMPWWLYIWPAVFMLAALLPDWKRNPIPSWWRKLLPYLWLLVSIAPFLALGLFREANLKFLLPAQIAVALLIGRGIWLLWEMGSPNLFLFLEALPRLLAVMGLFSMVEISMTSLQNLYTAQAYTRPDYRAMAQVITAAPRPDDAIVLDAPNQWEVFTYYYHGQAPIYPLPEGLGGDDVATATALDQVITKHRRIFVLYWGESERDPNRIVEKILAARAFEISSIWFGDVRFVQYATLPQSAGESIPLTAHFGDSISLQSAALTSKIVQPGDVLGITFTWATSNPLTQRYKIFIHLLDSTGTLVSQRDSEPGNNLAITSTWQPNQPITDAHGLLIPVHMPPGDYRIVVGLYDINQPSQRLAVNGTDHLDLGIIQVSR
jgi:mannosyltransferase